jgi:hypothetical protein
MEATDSPKNKQPKVRVMGTAVFDDLNKNVAPDTKIVDIGNIGLATNDPGIMHTDMETERAGRVITRTIPSGSGENQVQQESPDQK